MNRRWRIAPTLACAAMAGGCVWLGLVWATARPTAAASAATTVRAAATASTSPDPSASSVPAASAVPRPRIVRALIPYGRARRAQMAAYSRRHYGTATWRLHPRVVVLHFTAGSSYAGARAVFVSNARNLGELPGVAAHFIIAKDGTIYQLLSTRIRCRHTVGLNHRAIGIEMVQEAGRGSHWADRQILQRRRQIRAALRLVRYLRAKFSIRMRNVIGHAMANRSPLFKDLEGWRNDHTDWLVQDVRTFRRRLAALH